MAVLLWSVITIIITVIAIMTNIVDFNIVWLLFSAEIRGTVCCIGVFMNARRDRMLPWCKQDQTAKAQLTFFNVLVLLLSL